MSNEKVIQAFLNKEKAQTNLREISCIYSYKGRTLTSTASELINYNTIIAYWLNNDLYLNIKKYSQTTSKIQNTIKRLATEKNINIREYE